jgi:4-amino-4-deoxy-L-arabinose transferase-like glycosyltransferase
MTIPSPALVTQHAVQPMPRLALLLFCAAYVIPGVFGRDPWRNADVTAAGIMKAMADGRVSWLAPSLGGVPVEVALLPHWIGAAFIRVLSPAVDPMLAARLPFALLLALTLVCTWYAAFHLARTSAAQPVAFAFGGEADPVDYARATADSALLALIATLGLLQLGHETTPELVQLFATSMLLWSLAASPFRTLRARLAVLAALPVLAASGAPSMAIIFGLLGTVICWRSAYDQARSFAAWVAMATIAAAAIAFDSGTWGWRLAFDPGLDQVVQIARQWAWFTWPAGPLALWTLWRWRRQLFNRHVSVPLATVAVAMASGVWMGGSDRALLLALPGLALLAAFSLPTLRRSASAAVDWFSMLFFTIGVVFIWAMYIAMQTGVPARWSANVAKLAPGFEPHFSLLTLLLAAAGTVAWFALVRWRTGRHQQAIWKSLVIPAGGVALCWLLLMSLWLPLLDFARSYRQVVERVDVHVGDAQCIAARGFNTSAIASFELLGHHPVDARPDAARSGRCDALVHISRRPAAEALDGWELVAALRRPTDRTELVSIYRRAVAR